MTSGAEHTREGLQKRTKVDFDTPIQTAIFYEALGSGSPTETAS
jgi:hypothetical protein